MKWRMMAGGKGGGPRLHHGARGGLAGEVSLNKIGNPSPPFPPAEKAPFSLHARAGFASLQREGGGRKRGFLSSELAQLFFTVLFLFPFFCEMGGWEGKWEDKKNWRRPLCCLGGVAAGEDPSPLEPFSPPPLPPIPLFFGHFRVHDLIFFFFPLLLPIPRRRRTFCPLSPFTGCP